MENLSLAPTEVVLVGCGGSRTTPLGVCDLEIELFGFPVIVPTLVVATQNDDLIVGSNLLKHLIRCLKSSKDALNRTLAPDRGGAEQRRLLSLLANVEV